MMMMAEKLKSWKLPWIAWKKKKKKKNHGIEMNNNLAVTNERTKNEKIKIKNGAQPLMTMMMMITDDDHRRRRRSKKGGIYVRPNNLL